MRKNLEFPGAAWQEIALRERVRTAQELRRNAGDGLSDLVRDIAHRRVLRRPHFEAMPDRTTP